jgi:hypothetical protein
VDAALSGRSAVTDDVIGVAGLKHHKNQPFSHSSLSFAHTRRSDNALNSGYGGVDKEPALGVNRRTLLMLPQPFDTRFRESQLFAAVAERCLKC